VDDQSQVEQHKFVDIVGVIYLGNKQDTTRRMLGGEPVKMELSQDAEEAATWALTGGVRIAGRAGLPIG